MKISDFLPDIANRESTLIQSNALLKTMSNGNFANYLKTSYKGEVSAISHYGIEQLYFDWL